MKALITGAILLIGVLAIVYATSYWENKLGITHEKPEQPDYNENIANPVSFPQKCYVMRKIGTEEYSCFGCSGSVCVHGDLRIWEYISKEAATAKGYSCVLTDSGCNFAK